MDLWHVSTSFSLLFAQQAPELTVELTLFRDTKWHLWHHFNVPLKIVYSTSIVDWYSNWYILSKLPLLFHYEYTIIWLLFCSTWWRHQMETFSALLAICAGNSPVPGEIPTQRPVTRSFDVFFDLRLNKRLRKQSWGWWFETLSRPLCRHRNVDNFSVPHHSMNRVRNVLSFEYSYRQHVQYHDTIYTRADVPLI